MDNRTRFSGLGWFPDRVIGITIGGCGGIGSWTAFFLGRIGYHLNIWDDDKVEEHNLAGQLFETSARGKHKVSALSNMLSTFSPGSYINTYTARIDESFIVFNPFVISAFDNMKARKTLFEAFLAYCEEESSDKNALFIDGRLEAEQLQVFCVGHSDESAIERYRESLFEDSEVEDAPCTFKQTSHTAAMIGSFITDCLTNHIANINLGHKIREIPFKTEFYAPFMHLNKEL